MLKPHETATFEFRRKPCSEDPERSASAITLLRIANLSLASRQPTGGVAAPAPADLSRHTARLVDYVDPHSRTALG